METGILLLVFAVLYAGSLWGLHKYHVIRNRPVLKKPRKPQVNRVKPGLQVGAIAGAGKVDSRPQQERAPRAYAGTLSTDGDDAYSQQEHIRTGKLTADGLIPPANGQHKEH